MGYTVNSIVINKNIRELFLIINNIQNWPELHGYKMAEVLESKKLIDGKMKIVFKITGNEEENDDHHDHAEEDKDPETWISQRIIDIKTFSARGVRLEPVYPFKHWILDIVLSEEMDGTRMTWIQDFRMDEKTGHTDQEIEGYINKGSKEELHVFKEKIETGEVHLKLDETFFDWNCEAIL
jgi:aromatase